MTVFFRRLYLSLLLLLGATSLFAQSSALRLATTATVQPRWTALANHKIYLLTTTATQASGKNVMGILAATNKGLYQSLDTGQTWGNLGLPNDDVYDAVVIGGSIIAATDKGIQTRASVGAAWQTRTYPVSNQGSGSGSTQATVQQRGLPTYSLQTAGGRLFAATTRGVYRSNDGGATWTQTELSTAGTLSGKTVRTLALLGNTLFAAVWNDGIYRSSDNGATWTFTDIVPGSTVEKTFRTLAVYGATVYAGSSEGNLYQTQNPEQSRSGTTWTKVVSAGNNGQAGVNARGVEALARYGSTIVGAVYNGIAVSHNNGQTWSLMPIATQDVNTIIMLPPKPIVRRSSTFSAVAASKGSAILQLVTCDGNDGLTCGGGGIGVGSGGTSGGSSGGGVSGYGLPACNPLGANLNLTPPRAPEQPSALAVTFSISSQVTLTDFRIEMAAPGAPSSWIDITTSFNQNTTGFVNGSALIPAGFMQTPGTYSIRAFGIREDGACTGGYVSEAQSFIVDPAVPVLNSLSLAPTGAYTGQTTTLTLSGSNFFLNNAFVTFYNASGQPVSFPFVQTGNSGAMITVNFTAPASGLYYAEVRNRIGEVTYPSVRLPFTIAVPPAPVLSSVTLPSGALRVVAGATGVITLNGSSFSTTALDGSAGGAIVSVNGQNGLWSVTSRTASSLTVQLPVSVAAGTYTLQVINADGQQSASTLQVVVVPPLAVSSSSPATIFVEEQKTISLAGTFRTGATVVNAPNLAGAPALSVSDNGISFGVNIPGVNAPSSYTITLSEPTTYGQSAITHTIPVLFPLPALTSLTPNELDASPASGGAASTITIVGTGFTSRTSVFAGARDLSAFITSRSSSLLTLNFPVGTFPAPEIAQLRAENPGNQVSGTLPLTIKNVAPVLTTLMPQPLVATQSGQITITGSKFFNATVTQVFAGGIALAGATVTPSSITVTVPASLLPDIGTVDFEVRNTFGADVQTSAVQSVRVIHPTPEITSLAPLTIPAFDNAQTLTITGAKFSLTRSRVVWVKNGVETPLTLLPNPTATQLQVTIPASLLTELGAVTIRVQNQDAADANGGPSATSTLMIIPPVPIVTSVTPNTATAGAGAVPVVITGSKFTQAGLRLVIRNVQTGIVRDLNSPTFGNSSTVSGIIPADVVLLAGNYTLTVINAANGSGQGGGESTTSVPFTILNPAPTISSLSPNPATVYAPFTLDVQGTGFVSGATSVTVDGQTFAPASVTVVSSVLLRVSVAAITSAKNATVSVTNPQLNNQGGGTATTTFPVVPPMPTVSAAQGNGGGGTLTRNLAGTLTVIGTGFVDGATVLLNGQTLTTTFSNQNTLTAAVPASLLTAQGTVNVTVNNPQFGAQGGGTSSPAVTVMVQNPQAVLTSISPNAVTRGNIASIALSGSNFYDGALALLSGAVSANFATTFLSGGSLTLSIPASSLPVAGTYSVAVKNTEPTPGFSNSQTLTVSNPSPVLVSLSVNEAEAYSNDLTLTITGSGFENGIQAYWTPSGGSRQALAAPTGVSAGSCTLTIPAALLTQAGAFTITLENAAPSLGASNTLTFTVLDRVPTLTSVTPNAIEALSGNTQITLTGDYFAPSANAYWNGVLLTRVGAASRTSLTATVPASRLTLATIAAITVQNPQFSGRGGGTSTPARDLVITNPLPSLTDITPDFIAAGSTRSVITLTGTAFMPVSFVEVGNGSTWAAVTTTYVSPTRMTIVLSSAALVQPSVLMVRAVSPTISTLGGAPQGGGASAELPLVIRPGDPTLTRLSPTSATVSSTTPTVTITLIGTGFVPTSVVRVAGVPTTGTTYISPTQLRLTLARPAGIYNLSVHTPPVVLNGIPQGGGTSGTISFAFLNPQPSLTALTPATTAASLAEWTLRLTGADFTPTSRVRYNGTLVGIANVQFVSPTELRAAVPAPPIAATSITVCVENPIIAGQGGGNSATLPLAIEFPRPLLTSLSDYTTSASLVAWTMTINGKLFAPGASVTLNGTPITATVVSSTKILAVLPAAQMRHTGSYTLSVSNPAPGGGEASATFTVNNPNPTLTAIAPTGLPSGIPAGVTQAFTLIGTNFVTTSTIILDGAAIPTTTLTGVNWIATTTLTVSVPAWLISTSGSYTLRVVNPAPGGGQSGTKSFTVTTGSVAYAEFTGVTTAVLAGNADAFSIRFKDTFGNAVDYPATTVQFTNETGTSTGTISLNRTGVGAFNAPSRAYTIDGTYRLWISGIASTTGNASFVVDATNDARVVISGVVNRVEAGGTVPAFTVRYFDKFNNPTDRNIGAVTLRYSTGGTIRFTADVVRLSEGVYQTLPFVLTVADTYYVQVNGIGQVKTSYVSTTATVITGTLPSFDVTPTAAVRATLSGVDIDLNAGNTQSNAKVRSYDQFGNLTNVPTLTTLTFSNSTDATAGVQSSTGTVALTRTGFGLYDVDGTQIKYSGAYTLTSPEMAQTTGGRFFQVRSAAVSYVEFVGVPTIATIGNLEPVTIRFRDRYNNLLDRESLLTFTKMSGSPSSTGTIELARTTLGVSTATLLSLTDEGTYSLKVSGMTAIPIRGNTDVILIREGEITSVCFSVAPERIPAGTAPVIQAWYNLGDGERAFTHPREIIYTHSPSGMTGTIPMYRIGVGTSQSRPELQPFTLAGTYTLSVANPPNLPSCQTTFVVEGGTAASIIATAAPLECLTTAGESLTPLAFIVRDQWGNLTNAFNNVTLQPTPIIGTFTGTGINGVSTGTVALTTLATGTLTEIVPPRIFTTAGTYSMTVPIYAGGAQIAATTVTFCVQPDVVARVVARTSPNMCITAGAALSPLSFAVQDRFGNVTSAFNNATMQSNPYIATFVADAPVVSTGTIMLTANAAGELTEIAPSHIFTTAGTYRLIIPIYNGANLLPQPIPYNFCVNPDVAAVAIVSSITPSIFVNGTQTPVLTVRDRWGNLTNYAGTLSYTGAANGTIAFTQQSPGVYGGATTTFGVSGNYTLAAGMLETRGITAFSVILQPALAVSRTTLDLNASVTTALTQNLTVSGTFDVTYQNMPNGTTITLTAPTGFLISTPTCTTPAQQCVLTVSGSGTVGVTVNFVRTPQTLAGSYSGALTVVSSNNLTPPVSVQIRGEAYSCGGAFPDPPKISFLVLHTDLDGYFNYWRGERQTNPRAGRFRGADNMREYIMESLDLSNLVNRNSGVNLRFSLDPVIYSTSAVVNINGMSGALTTEIRDNWYYPSANANDRYTFGGGEYQRISDILNDNASILSQLRQSVQADIVVLVGSVPDTWIDAGTTRRVYSAAGIAGGLGISNDQQESSFFLLDINRTFPKSLIFTHEAGHLCGGGHDFRDWSFYTNASAGAIIQFPANPPAQTATIDFGWYHRGRYIYNELYDPVTGRNLELSALTSPSSLIEIGTVMAQFQPKVMNWSNPAVSVTIPESGALLPTGNTPPGTFSGLTYEERNMAARMNSDNNTSGTGGGRTVANFYQEHITSIDASISGVRTLATAESSTYRVNICGTLAARPFTYRWLMQQAGTQAFTEVGTAESYTLTMPNNRELRLRVEVTDSENHRVTAEAYIACAACAIPPPPQAASVLKGSAHLTNSTTESVTFEFPVCAGDPTNPKLMQSLVMSNSAKPSAMVTNQRQQSAAAQQNMAAEEIPNSTILEQPYPNPSSQEITVSFSTPKENHINLALYDMLGRTVQTIVDERYSRGRKTFNVLVNTLPSGVYALRLRTAEGQIIVKTITIAH